MAPAALLMNESWPSKRVCVMGSTGPLGSTLVQRLLERGYAVHAAALRHYPPNTHVHGGVDCLEGILSSCDDEKKNKRLRVFDTDPLDYHSILDALKGCSGLFYCFDPPSDRPTYDELMAEVEARAAHNVLEACAQTSTIDKVVFTSSATAVIWQDGRNTMPDLDERNWSDISFCKKYKLWHGLSKTLAEKAAWALAMDRGLNMVSINGGLLIGSSPHGHQLMTVDNPYLKGAAEMYEDGVFVTVDLGFLVDAHICVYEDVSSYGRYLCFNEVIDSNTAALKLAHMLFPSSPSSPSPQSLEEERVYQQRISNKKLNKLMVDFKRGLLPV
ncbi:cinnamoyl-CoA reductase 1-like [Rhododendron vialii]|uniref:cinnamoyl-CoA reductase 1-like n=1 Tax=Rhododendron vialii TaxID=182163 RepID=UPI00265E39BD|nr:cinnamoyl-CoA reductase 1-like [Rhododendron vialii]